MHIKIHACMQYQPICFIPPIIIATTHVSLLLQRTILLDSDHFYYCVYADGQHPTETAFSDQIGPAYSSIHTMMPVETQESGLFDSVVSQFASVHPDTLRFQAINESVRYSLRCGCLFWPYMLMKVPTAETSLASF